MSLSIRQSFVEQFSFNGKNVRAVYIQDVGECLVACDVYEAMAMVAKLAYRQYRDLFPISIRCGLEMLMLCCKGYPTNSIQTQFW